MDERMNNEEVSTFFQGAVHFFCLKPPPPWELAPFRSTTFAPKFFICLSAKENWKRDTKCTIMTDHMLLGQC